MDNSWMCFWSHGEFVQRKICGGMGGVGVRLDSSASPQNESDERVECWGMRKDNGLRWVECRAAIKTAAGVLR